jgi:glycosyltransferase involved in cell wall biosynthesis
MSANETAGGSAPAPSGSAPRAPEGLRTAVVGVSVNRVCGVHDHAVSLAAALGREGVSHSEHWLWRSKRSARASQSELRAWTRELAGELEHSRPDAIVLHYSVFSYSYRGLPVFVGPVMSVLRRLRVPVVVVLHEFAYAWRYGGWRGDVWALTQRLALIEVMRASAAAIVTTDFRARWLQSRPWLARRPVAFAPVFSNLPAPHAVPRVHDERPLVGLFGYAYQGAEQALVLDAVRELSDRGQAIELMLLGGGGRASSAGEAWLRAAREREIAQSLSFSGTLPAQELSDALAACDVLLSAFTPGPSSRKGTLAASLASGRPVIAIDGPRGWSELVRSGAIDVVAPTSQAVTGAIVDLLGDEQRREALGAQGREFAEQRMGVQRTADALGGLLNELLGGGDR